MIRDHSLRLKDGRILSFREHGDAHGVPVFFFHGTPGSRVMLPDEAVLHELKIRMITVDRPGYGLSHYKPGRKLLDWPEDVAELADHLGIEQFALVGFSGGGPHAMACAIRLQSRIRAMALVSSLGPGGPKNKLWQLRLHVFLAVHAPVMLRLGSWPVYKVLLRNFERYFDWGISKLPNTDQQLGKQPTVREIFRFSFAEAFRQGSLGYVSELGLLCRDWGFSPADVRIQAKVWHGMFDSFQPARNFAEILPNCDPMFLEEGHLLLFKHWKEILQSVLL